MSEIEWRKTTSYGMTPVTPQSLRRAVLCLFLRHHWQPGPPRMMFGQRLAFSRRAEHFFTFRSCARCNLLQTRPRRSERFG